jgi:Leucine-rich repeat (LRR) protein
MKALTWSYVYCCSLEELRVDRNALCRLPRALTRLQKLRILLVGHNNLTELSGFLLAMKALTSLVSFYWLTVTRMNNEAFEVRSNVGVNKIRLARYSIQAKAVTIS